MGRLTSWRTLELNKVSSILPFFTERIPATAAGRSRDEKNAVAPLSARLPGIAHLTAFAGASLRLGYRPIYQSRLFI